MADTIKTSGTPTGDIAREGVLPSPYAPGEHAHPSERQYVVVALILATVTALEVVLYYLDLSKTLLVVLLIACAVVKFAIVVMWFMHLRFDSRLFRQFFIAGLALAIGVYTVVLLTFGVFISERPPSRPQPGAGGAP